jgi:hypothetical protein
MALTGAMRGSAFTREIVWHLGDSSVATAQLLAIRTLTSNLLATRHKASG